MSDTMYEVRHGELPDASKAMKDHFAAALRRAFAFRSPVGVDDPLLLVAFGGLPMKNTFVAPGGMSRHGIRQHLADAAEPVGLDDHPAQPRVHR